MPSRRGFLGGLVAIAAGTTPKVVVPDPDTCLYRGYELKWSGWRAPVNQFIVFGWWQVEHNHPEWDTLGLQRPTLVSTTGGFIQHMAGHYVVDSCHDKDHPFLTGWSTEGEKAVRRTLALNRLKEVIDGFDKGS